MSWVKVNRWMLPRGGGAQGRVLGADPPGRAYHLACRWDLACPVGGVEGRQAPWLECRRCFGCFRQAACVPPDWTPRFLQGAEVWEWGFLQRRLPSELGAWDRGLRAGQLRWQWWNWVREDLYLSPDTWAARCAGLWGRGLPSLFPAMQSTPRTRGCPGCNLWSLLPDHLPTAVGFQNSVDV